MSSAAEDARRKAPARSARPRCWESLKGPNFRYCFAALIVSNLGTWVQAVAESWVVLQLSHSGLALAVTSALQWGPALLLGPYGGVIVDRLDRRRLLMATQIAFGLLALSVGTLIATGLVKVWMIWLAALALGITKCFDSPALQSFTKEVVGTEDLPNALALTAATVAFARMIGPAIGGMLLAFANPAICFYLNASSFLVALLALFVIDVRKLHLGGRAPRASGQVLEGLRYVRGKPVLATTLAAIFVTAASAYNFQVLLPIVAANALAGGPDLYGELMSMLGAGALLGSLVMASRVRPTLQGLAFWCLALGAGEFGLAMSSYRAAAFAAALMMGVASASFTITASSILQINTADGLRGRVMSLYTTAFFGSGLVGAPVAGGLAQYFGVRVALTVAATLCLLVTTTVTVSARFGGAGKR